MPVHCPAIDAKTLRHFLNAALGQGEHLPHQPADFVCKRHVRARDECIRIDDSGNPVILQLGIGRNPCFCRQALHFNLRRTAESKHLDGRLESCVRRTGVVHKRPCGLLDITLIGTRTDHEQPGGSDPE